MKIKLTEKNICVFFMTLLCFLDTEPFFVWSSVSSLGYRVYTSVILITTVILMYKVFFKKTVVTGVVSDLTNQTHISLSLLLASGAVVMLFFYEVFLSGVVTETQQPFNIAMLCIHIGLMMFILQDNLMLGSVYRTTKILFALSLIPAIFVFLCLQFGIGLPHVSLSADAGKEMTGQSYELYLGLATMLRNQGGQLNRLCGMYREPGFVGTLGALFLLGDKISLKKWENVVILVACLFTFSLAFFIMLILGLMFRAVGKMKTKNGATIGFLMILLLVVGYFVFINIPINPNSMLGELQGRLIITEDGLAGDNRFGSSEWAEDAYDAFLQMPLSVRLFGYGKDLRTVPGTKVSIWQSVCSYKEYVFGFGFLGLGIVIAGLVLSILAKYRKLPRGQRWNIIVLLLVFLISIYQRYNVTNFHYYCVLFGGAANLALMEGETADAETPPPF